MLHNKQKCKHANLHLAFLGLLAAHFLDHSNLSFLTESAVSSQISVIGYFNYYFPEIR